MKAKRLFLFLVMPLIMAFVSCDNGTTSSDASSVPGNNLAEKLDWLQKNAESGGNYVVDLYADESNFPGQKLEYNGKSNITITLRGSSENRTINLSNNGNLFLVRSGVSLVLDNITLRGRSFNSYSLVFVGPGGTLRMNNGAAITGNTTNRNGGGVWVEGTFTMNSGTISSNAAAINGGGVAVSGGSFTMNGGTISSNNADKGSGVAVLGKGTFIMRGGTISGNNARNGGGGVAVQYGTCTMNNGTISGNISERDGGGVYTANVRDAADSILGIGNFIMNGGTISGNAAKINGGGVGVSNEGTFVMNNGSITGNTGERGGGVSVDLNTTFTISGGTISNNTAKIGGGGAFIWGVFSKTGGTITGYDDDRSNGNVVSNSPGFVESQSGHAVYASYSGSRLTKRKETTAGLGVNLSYTGRTGSFSGEWDY